MFESSQVTTRILVVEDEEDIRSLIDAVLASENVEMSFACDVAAAKAAVAVADPDLILLDLALPRGLEGLQFLDWYSAEARGRARVIIVSALGPRTLAFLENDPRIAATLHKPFEVEELLALLERFRPRS